MRQTLLGLSAYLGLILGGLGFASGALADEIHDASASGEVPKVEVLLAGGVDVNARDADGLTPLHRAVQAGRFAVVRLLVSSGADVDAKNTDGQTALFQVSRS